MSLALLPAVFLAVRLGAPGVRWLFAGGGGALRCFQGCGGDASERAGHARQADRVHGGAAPVERPAGHRLTGEVGDGRVDRLLQRMPEVAIGRGRPVVDHAGGQHCRVFARTVLEGRGGIAALAKTAGPLARVVRQVRGVLQVVLSEPVVVEDLADTVQMEGFARVARAREGEEAWREGEARADHRHRLERFVAGSRKDGGMPVPDGEQVGAGVVNDGDAPAMDRLDEVAPDHMGEDGGGEEGCWGSGAGRGRGGKAHGIRP